MLRVGDLVTYDINTPLWELGVFLGETSGMTKIADRRGRIDRYNTF